MPRPVKWSRDLYLIREHVGRSKTETWSRREIEDAFSVGRATAQTLMKAIGDVQSVGAAYFIERSSLLSFLDEMILAPSVEEAFRQRVLEAKLPPAPKTLRVALPQNLRNIMVRDLPLNISLLPGRLEITAGSLIELLESLALLAQAMQNDLESVRTVLEPATSAPVVADEDLRSLLANLRRQR